MKWEIFVEFVQKTFGCSLRYVDACVEEVRTIAICGGAGSEFVDQAAQQGADVYITADMKYHEMQTAQGQIGVIDLDHWTSEHFTREIFEDLLRNQIPTHIAQSDTTPVQWLVK